MTPVRANPIPLPGALLALSVAVCIGAATPALPAHASAEMTRQAEAEQRQTFEHLLAAINEAARKLGDRLHGQAAHPGPAAARVTPTESARLATPADDRRVRPTLRASLLNLPPPAGC